MACKESLLKLTHSSGIEPWLSKNIVGYACTIEKNTVKKEKDMDMCRKVK